MIDKFWVGIDLGGTNIRAGIFDDCGVMLKEKRESTEAEKGPDTIIQKITAMINEVADGRKINGIGIGMPGPLDPYKGIVQNPVNLPGWDNIPMAGIISDRFKVPCFIDNDANVAALAEATSGAGREYNIVFYITISTGVGGGLCIKKSIINGATGNAAEIANIIIDKDGPKHSFLNRGSLESIASGTGIARMAKEAGLPAVTTQDVFRLAVEGNAGAAAIVDKAIDALARGMSTIAHVIDPDIFVLGGGVGASVPGFCERVRVSFEEYIYAVMRGKIKVEKALLTDPGMLGAMYLVKKKCSEA